MIDARGRSCPEPVLMIKKAVSSKEDEYNMLLDSRAALENVTRFVATQGYHVYHKEEKGTYELKIIKD